ncbi:MAG: SGNH/GDSL hydrolase family protein [Myxococcota bacterium]
MPSYTNLYTFGDSLVDGGSVFGLTGGTTPDPALGYCAGRFTNCPVVPTDPITPADSVSQAITGGNANTFLAGGTNFAFGGARANNLPPQSGQIVPDLGDQLLAYLQEVGAGNQVVDPGALYLINVGGNDARDIVLQGLTGPARAAYIQSATDALQGFISVLKNVYGIQHVGVVGPGDVGGIPEVKALGAAAQAAGRAASEDISAAFAGVASTTGSQFFDTIALTDAVLADPALFGLPAGLNVDDACLLAGAAPPGGAPVCNDFAFFDPVHPTTQVLQILGQGIVNQFVPEPGTAVLVGMGLFGMGLRRRLN